MATGRTTAASTMQMADRNARHHPPRRGRARPPCPRLRRQILRPAARSPLRARVPAAPAGRTCRVRPRSPHPPLDLLIPHFDPDRLRRFHPMGVGLRRGSALTALRQPVHTTAKGERQCTGYASLMRNAARAQTGRAMGTIWRVDVTAVENPRPRSRSRRTALSCGNQPANIRLTPRRKPTRSSPPTPAVSGDRSAAHGDGRGHRFPTPLDKPGLHIRSNQSARALSVAVGLVCGHVEDGAPARRSRQIRAVA